MQEIEVKILDINVNAIEKKLGVLGAKRKGEYAVKSVIFDTPDKKLFKRKELLRLRKKNEETIITHKTNVKEGKTKSCEETEIIASDFELTAKILRSIGFNASKPAYKKRISYKLKNSAIEIDIYNEIPPFLEIESPDEKELEEIVKLLGYTTKDTTPWNGWEVFRHYGKKLEG